MYGSDLQTRDKGGAIIAVAAVHAGLLLALLQISGRIDLADPQNAMRVFDVNELEPPPPQPPPPPPEQRQAQAPKEESGGAPANIKSQATPVVAPKPRIKLPTPQKIAVAETPRQGADPTQGASNVHGSGTGAGGSGTGTGTGTGGGSGSGTSDGGIVQPPQLITPVLRARDFPPQMLDAWPRGAQLFLRMRIDQNGYVSQCVVDRGTGNRLIDLDVCRTAQARLRYRPALNADGRPVAGWAGYRQTPPR